jgi:hypothetical protein
MKKIFILFIALLGVCVYSQVPVKGDNIILLTTNKTPEENYDLFGKYLISEGFSFDVADKEFMTIKTAPRTAINKQGGQSNYHYRFIVTFNDSDIKIKPELELLTIIYSMSWTEWEFSPAKGNLNYWYWMYNFKPILEKYEGKKEIIYIGGNENKDKGKDKYKDPLYD